RARIERAIERLPSVQRQLMRARYIDGKCWDAISAEMHYDERHLRRIHDKALLSMKYLHKGRRNNKNICSIPKD
ncbi:MAG: hypothetical protein LBH95_02905, partial [Oscillospiraceae bacterium]|nr:hypothetical protein [Oscillospiraceae bacterium]